MKTFLLLLLIILYPQKASAYIDPGTGTYFLQFLIAVIIGGVFVFKNQFKKLKLFFGRLAKKKG